jgi:hypothetical protein
MPRKKVKSPQKIAKEWKLTYNPEVDIAITTTKRYLSEYPYIKICEQTVIDVARCIVIRLINGFKEEKKTEELKDLLVIIGKYVSHDIFEEDKHRKHIAEVEADLEKVDRKHYCKKVNRSQKKPESFDGGMYV